MATRATAAQLLRDRIETKGHFTATEFLAHFNSERVAYRAMDNYVQRVVGPFVVDSMAMQPRRTGIL